MANNIDLCFQVKEVTTGAAPTYTKKAHARFDNVSFSSHTFSVRAANQNGTADTVSSVLIPSGAEMVGLAPRSLTKIYTEAGRFQIAWRPPTWSAAVVSYTLFWCLPEDLKDRPYQCDGRLDWKTIRAGPANETQSHDLLLPTASVYQVALAANTHNISSGRYRYLAN